VVVSGRPFLGARLFEFSAQPCEDQGLAHFSAVKLGFWEDAWAEKLPDPLILHWKRLSGRQRLRMNMTWLGSMFGQQASKRACARSLDEGFVIWQMLSKELP